MQAWQRNALPVAIADCMRVAFVDTNLEKPPTGGCQTFLVNICTALRARADIHVVYERGYDASVTRRLCAAGVTLHHDLWDRWAVPEERASRVAAWARAAGMDVFVVSVSPDVGWLALPLLDSSVTTLAIVHADGPAFYRPLTYYASFVDSAVGVSAATHARIIAECGIPAERATHIPYGIAAAPLSRVIDRWTTDASPRALRLVYVGRLEHTQKRIRDLPLLLSELWRRGLAFEMDVIGDGPERGWLRREISQSPFVSFVRLLGWLGPDEVSQRLLHNDLLLLFSSSEGLPLALLEAMGHAVVPLVTRIPGGHSEVVRDGENGYLVPVGDSRALADRACELAAHPERLERLRRAAWETSQHFSIERMAESYQALFDSSAVGRVRAPRPEGAIPPMESCRSRYPLWLRRLKWGLLGSRHLRIRP